MAANFDLIKQVLDLIEDFEFENKESVYSSDIDGFKNWIADHSKSVNNSDKPKVEPDWVAKENGRSPESVISTMLVHLNKYAKMYSKSVILNSPFSTQEEFIYLINLKSYGALSKTELIRMNIQDKPTGIQIINRLIQQGFAIQIDSNLDKRSKLIEITKLGLETLEANMLKIRQATKIVSGDLSMDEKLELIRLLGRLTDFHNEIYNKNIHPTDLLFKVVTDYLPSIN